MLFLTICKQLSIKMLNWLSVSRDVRRRECPLMNGVWRFPLQDAGPSTTLLVRTMDPGQSVALLSPGYCWHHGTLTILCKDMRPCELNDIANLSTAGQGTMSRAGLGGRSVDTSPVQGRATQVPALLGLQGRPAMPCYALLCPASAKSLSEKSRE